MSENKFEDDIAGKDVTLIQEFILFLKHNKKWWLVPILVCLLGLGILVVYGSSAAAPFIYALF